MPRGKDKLSNLASRKQPKPWLSKYEEDFPVRAYDILSKGESKVACAAEFGCSRETFDNWLNPDHAQYKEELAQAVQVGLINSQRHWEKISLDNVVSEKGKTLNANAWAFTMKNRFSKDYRDEQVVKSDHKFSKLSNDDIDAEIKRIVDADQPSIKLISNE